jgi:uncharacterized membrane protein YeiB
MAGPPRPAASTRRIDLRPHHAGHQAGLSSLSLQAPSLTRNIITLLVSVAVVAVTSTFRLAPSRRRMWWLALATHAALAVLNGWLFTWLAVAPSAEGMASFAALIVGPVVVAIPVIGLVALLLPSARTAALGHHQGGPRAEL